MKHAWKMPHLNRWSGACSLSLAVLFSTIPFAPDAQANNENAQPNAIITTNRTSSNSSVTQDNKITVQGTIVDNTGMPIIGANILVVGTSSGTISDIDGHFTLEAAPDAQLKITYVGFNEQTVSISGQKTLNITLQEDTETLDEVIVIGYGTTTKRKMVGSVSSIGADKLEETSFTNVGEALQGQVSGLVVQSSGGMPGSVPTISIRGAGTPLFVIDGVIGSEYDFSVLNPEDIQSMSFLKDASATAVYGSKAGNGIVLVKTKRGEEGRPVLKYNTSLQISQPTMEPDYIGGMDYLNAVNDVYMKELGEPAFNDEQMQKYRDGSDYNNYQLNNWPDLLLKDFTTQQKHNLSISGGSKNTNYYVSFGYVNQNGMLESDAIYMKRYNVRSNVSTNFEKIGLKVGVNMAASLQKTRAPGFGTGVWHQLYYANKPNTLAYNEDGTLAGNPYNMAAATSRESGYIKNRNKTVDAQITLDWTVKQVEGLKFGFLGSYSDSDHFYKTWTPMAAMYNPDGTLYDYNKNPDLTAESGYGHTLDTQFSANYQRQFGKHGIDATFVYNVRQGRNQYVEAYRRDYLSSSVDQIIAGPTVNQSTGGTENESASQGYVMRLKYDYDARYILEFSGRYDGNDNFSKDERWGFFPAVSGVWMISDEPFMETIREKGILSSLKLRASYGETGVSSGATRFGYIPVYNIVGNDYVVDGVLQPGFEEGNLVNPAALTWYTRKSTNVGFDFTSLGGQLEGSVDYFYYKTTGFLMSPQNQYYTTLGKPLPEISSGSKHRRAGCEFALRYKKRVNNKLYFEIGGNISYYDQLWEQLDSESEADLKNPWVRQTHQKDNFGSTYLNGGLFQNGNEILNNARPLSSSETAPGDIRYVDTNGDGKIDENDMRRLGKPSFPHMTYGIDFRVNYDAWSLNGVIQGTGDRYTFLGDGWQRGDIENYTVGRKLDFWTPDNTNARFPRPGVTSPNNENNMLLSDFYVENAKYVRLKSLSISYDLKKKVLKNFDAISGCSLSLTGTNLLTFSNIMDYCDPEAKMLQLTDTYSKGHVGSSHPINRTYSLGLSVQF